MGPVGKVTLCFLFMWLVNTCLAANKYSKEMNLNLENAEKAFRMNKINVLWEKAQKRLGPEKLKSLYSDLKLQDKEEINLKRIRADDGDKDGLKEAALRKKFRALMDKYGLGEQLEHVEEIHGKKYQGSAFNEATRDIAKQKFTDDKIEKLWQKAKSSGFTAQELMTLYEELSHHQEKLEEYHRLMDDLGQQAGNREFDNTLNQFEGPDDDAPSKSDKLRQFQASSQLLKEKHKELKNSYDKLSKMTKERTDEEFGEFRVQELWKLAMEAKFPPDELASLKEELQHYEHRVKKLKHLQMQVDFNTVDGDKLLPEHKTCFVTTKFHLASSSFVCSFFNLISNLSNSLLAIF